MQVEGAKAKSGAGKADSSQEEQDELELPNFHKHGRGAGMPLLGQVSLFLGFPAAVLASWLMLALGEDLL